MGGPFPACQRKADQERRGQCQTKYEYLNNGILSSALGRLIPIISCGYVQCPLSAYVQLDGIQLIVVETLMPTPFRHCCRCATPVILWRAELKFNVNCGYPQFRLNFNSARHTIQHFSSVLYWDWLQ